jgi:hypothetical protein
LSASRALDGHSNGAEQGAIRARDLGMEVIYEGIRLTPAQTGPFGTLVLSSVTSQQDQRGCQPQREEVAPALRRHLLVPCLLAPQVRDPAQSFGSSLLVLPDVADDLLRG